MMVDDADYANACLISFSKEILNFH